MSTSPVFGLIYFTVPIASAVDLCWPLTFSPRWDRQPSIRTCGRGNDVLEMNVLAKCPWWEWSCRNARTGERTYGRLRCCMYVLSRSSLGAVHFSSDEGTLALSLQHLIAFVFCHRIGCYFVHMIKLKTNLKTKLTLAILPIMVGMSSRLKCDLTLHPLWRPCPKPNSLVNGL